MTYKRSNCLAGGSRVVGGYVLPNIRQIFFGFFG